jgi:hypothetical protein
MTFLGELNRDIVDTHKSLADLNETMAMTLQDSKKWNIVSRLLSGTGLWAIQNRLRALISIVGEYNRATIQQLEDAQKSAELLDKLGSRTENLAKATENFNRAMGHDMDSLKDAREKELTDLAKAQKVKEEMHNYNRDELKEQLTLLGIAHKGSEHKAQLEKKLNRANYDEIVRANDALKLQEENLTNLSSVVEERERLAKNYGVSEMEANAIMSHRLKLMKEAADKQDDILKGTEKTRKLEGKLLVKQAQIKSLEESGQPKWVIDMYKKQEGSLKFELIIQKFVDFATRVGKTAWKVFKFALKSIFIWMPIIMLTVFTLYQVTKRAWPLMQKWWGEMSEWIVWIKDWAFDWSTQLEAIGEAWKDLKEAWENGDLGEFMISIGKILWNLAVIVLKALVGTVFVVIWAAAAYIWGAITSGFTSANTKTAKAGLVLSNILTVIGSILLLFGTISVIFFSGSWIPIIVGAIAVGIGTWLRSKIPGLADGGIAKGGLTLVGERGPELVNLPKGSRVHSNAESKRMGGNTINVHVNGRLGASDTEIRDIARKVGAQINREINRTTSSGTRM